MTTVDLPPRAVEQLAAERSRAETHAQSAPAETTAPAAPPTTPAVTEPPLTLEAHAETVNSIAGLLVLAGGREVPASKRDIVISLTFPAAKKYHGGEIPYFAEAMAIAGIGLLVREAYFTKDPEQPADKPTTAETAARRTAA